MNIIDKLYDHNLEPYKYELNGDILYDLSNDPLIVDFDYITRDLDIPDVGRCSIVIMANEENLSPRFHLFNNDGSFACCIGLDNAEYFENDDEHSRLNYNQRNSLNEFMNSIIINGDIQQWLYIYRRWCTENDQDDLHDNIELVNKPDYTQLPN